MAIPDVEANGFAMELLESRLIRIVDKHKLLYLVLVNKLPPNQSQLHTYIWEETYEESISIKKEMMVSTHEQSIAWFMPGMGLGLRRNPSASLEVGPLCFN